MQSCLMSSHSGGLVSNLRSDVEELPWVTSPNLGGNNTTTSENKFKLYWGSQKAAFLKICDDTSSFPSETKLGRCST